MLNNAVRKRKNNELNSKEKQENSKKQKDQEKLMQQNSLLSYSEGDEDQRVTIYNSPPGGNFNISLIKGSFFLKNWGKWNSHIQFKIEYVETTSLLAHIKNIQDTLSKDKAIVRISGLSGLGKTRLALEALKSDGIKYKVRYIDVSSMDSGDIISNISRLVTKDLLFVVDNCTSELHEKILNEVLRVDSHSSLMTIGYEKVFSANLSENLVSIHLVASVENKKIIFEMIRNKLNNISQRNINGILKYSRGYPKVAELLINFYDDNFDPEKLVKSNFIKKLLFKDCQPPDRVYQVIQTLSLFSFIGYRDNLKHQYEFIANEISGINPKEFFEILTTNFSGNELVQYYGRFITLTPPPVAWALAIAWFNKQQPDTLIDIIEKILSNDCAEYFIERMQELDFSKEVTSKFSFLLEKYEKDPHQIFDEAGRKLFDYLIRVNPKSALKTAQYCFVRLQQEPNIDFERQILFCDIIHKFLVYNETSELAWTLFVDIISKLPKNKQNDVLMRYFNFFRIEANTQLSIEKRLDLLVMAIEKYKASEALNLFFVVSLGEMLDIEDRVFNKKDWIPTDEFINNIERFLKRVVSKLINYSTHYEGKIGKHARQYLIRNFFVTKFDKLFDIYITHFKEMREKGVFDAELLECCFFRCKYMHANPAKLRIIWPLLKPLSLKEEIEFYINKHWAIVIFVDKNDKELIVKKAYKEDECFIDLVITKQHDYFDYVKEIVSLGDEFVKLFAEEIARDVNLFDEFLRNLSLLFINNDFTHKCDLFAQTLTHHLTKNNNEIKLRKLLNAVYAEINHVDEKPIVFLLKACGVITEAKPTIFNEFLNKLRLSENCKKYYMIFLSRKHINKKEISYVTKIIREKHELVCQLSYFSQEKFNNISRKDVCVFIDFLVKIGNDGIYQLFRFIKNKKFLMYFEKILTAVNIKYLLEPYGHVSFFDYLSINRENYNQGVSDSLVVSKRITSFLERWSDCCLYLVKNRSSNSKFDNFLENISKKIIKLFFNKKQFFIAKHEHQLLFELAFYLIDNFQEKIFSMLQKKVFEKKFFCGMAPGVVLGSSFNTQNLFFDRISFERLEKWCNESPDHAPIFLSENARLVKLNQEGKYVWNQLGLFLLEHYGDKLEITQAVGRNLGASSWSGSMVPLLKEHSLLLEPLINNRFNNVREWALRLVNHNDKKISSEENFDAERNAGINAYSKPLLPSNSEVYAGLSETVVNLRDNDLNLQVTPPKTKKSTVTTVTGSDFKEKFELDNVGDIGGWSYVSLKSSTFMGPVSINNHLHQVSVKPRKSQLLNQLKAKKPAVWNLPRHDNLFVGRRSLLEDLRKKLNPAKIYRKRSIKVKEQNENQETVLAIAVCSGLGGVGKTQLALEYVYDDVNKYNLKAWFSAENVILLEQQYLEFAKDFGCEDEKPDIKKAIKYIKRCLEKHPGWLLIYDNVEKYKDIVSFLPDAGGNVLITTRNQKWPVKIERLPIDVMDEVDAITLVRKIIEKESTQAQDAEIKALVAVLGYLPLALAQASAYIREKVKTISEYLALYKQYEARLLEDNTLPEGTDHAPVAVTWNTSLDAVEAKLKEASKPSLAHGLMMVCAYFAPENIPRAVILNWLQSNYPNIEAPLVLDEILTQLQRYSLITLNPTKQSFSIHRLVQTVLRYQYQEKKVLNAGAVTLTEDWYKHVLEAVNQEFNRRTTPLEEEHRQIDLFPHLQALESYYNVVVEIVNKEIELARASILHNIGFVFISRIEHPKAAIKLFDRALKIQKKYFDVGHIEMVGILGNFGIAYSALGEQANAKAYFKRVLKIQKQCHGKEHPEVAVTLTNLGNVYNALGDTKKAKTFFEHALNIDEKHYGKEYIGVAVALTNLGNANRILGDLKKAQEVLERALKIKEQYYGIEHPEVATSLIKLASVFCDLKRQTEAETCCKSALKIQKRYYGNDHPKVAAVLNQLGNVYHSLRNFKKAKLYYELALNIQENHYDRGHQEIAATLSNLGDVNRMLGDVKKAQELLKSALKIKKQHYGMEHPDVALTVYNLAKAHIDDGKYDIAYSYASRCYKIYLKTRGPNHKHTKYALHLLLECQNSYKKLLGKKTDRNQSANKQKLQALLPDSASHSQIIDGNAVSYKKRKLAHENQRERKNKKQKVYSFIFRHLFIRKFYPFHRKIIKRKLFLQREGLIRIKNSQNLKKSSIQIKQNLNSSKMTAHVTHVSYSDHEWFTDDEMNRLMYNFFGNRSNVRLVAGINAEQDKGIALIENLQEIQLQQTLALSLTGFQENTLIIPLNLGNRHWTALYIYFNTSNRLKPVVGYFDPLGHRMPVNLRKKLVQIYTQLEPKDILISPVQLQDDSYNCGPWVIAILQHLIDSNGLHLPPENFNIYLARHHYRELLESFTKGTFPLKMRLKKVQDELTDKKLEQEKVRTISHSEKGVITTTITRSRFKRKAEFDNTGETVGGLQNEIQKPEFT